MIFNLSAKSLKIISRHGVGYDNIDLKSSKDKNITIAITATANAVAVAEHVMFMLLNISKRKNMYDDCVKSGKFNERNKLPKKTSQPIFFIYNIHIRLKDRTNDKKNSFNIRYYRTRWFLSS